MKYTVEVWGNLPGITNSFKTLAGARHYLEYVKRTAALDGYKLKKTAADTWVSKNPDDEEMLTISKRDD